MFQVFQVFQVFIFNLGLLQPSNFNPWSNCIILISIHQTKSGISAP